MPSRTPLSSTLLLIALVGCGLAAPAAERGRGLAGDATPEPNANPKTPPAVPPPPAQPPNPPLPPNVPLESLASVAQGCAPALGVSPSIGALGVPAGALKSPRALAFNPAEPAHLYIADAGRDALTIVNVSATGAVTASRVIKDRAQYHCTFRRPQPSSLP